MALHERSVKRGDEITFIRRDADNTLRGLVVGHARNGDIEVTVGRKFLHLVSYSEEGVRWIRGHHREGTRAVEALLAADKLARMVE